ncbi:MAG: phosphatase PAP2 family protein [Thermoleophilia bacterium]|nr:phosphatase PAP2 family protein [Thermoleophilia bacterium]
MNQEQLSGGEKNDGLDRRLFIALRTRWHVQPLQAVLTALSVSGNNGFLWIGLAVPVFWAAGDGLLGIVSRLVFMAVVVYSTLAINYAVKQILGHERPALDDPALLPLVGVPSSKSFPSSHAAMSFAAATIYVYFMTAVWPFFLAFALFYGLALLVSWSRVYVGVHFPSDVLAGMFVGLASGCFWAIFLHFL